MMEMKDAVAEATPSKTSYFSRILDQLRARGRIWDRAANPN
jgi:hypothetical protein